MPIARDQLSAAMPDYGESDSRRISTQRANPGRRTEQPVSGAASVGMGGTSINQNSRLTIVSFMAKRRGERQANPGAELRAIRQQLGWSLREVHAASVALAKKHRQPAFVIPPSRLHDIESKNKIPTIHRLYALALIYGRTLKEILSLYGIPL